jgi:4-hydroxyphenylpyruvate dioxygenase-like putative hemolysin
MNTDTSSHQLEKVVADAEDFLPLLGTDYIELYVGNAKQAAYYYISAWGFQPLAYCGLETGVKDRVSYVLQQDKIRLVLTSSLQPDGPINAHVNAHGDGVKVIAIWVDDAMASLIAEAGWHIPDYQGTNGWIMPVPAAFVVDTDGRIVARHVDPDYRKRMEPGDASGILKRLGSQAPRPARDASPAAGFCAGRPAVAPARSPAHVATGLT